MHELRALLRKLFHVSLCCLQDRYFLMIHQEDRVPVKMYVDSCSTACGLLCHLEAYHMPFPTQVLSLQHHICHQVALNLVMTIRWWALCLRGRLVHLYSDSATAVAFFQAGRGRDLYIQACAREL